MNTHKTFKIMLMALLLTLALCVTGTTADAAKKKTYKTKDIIIHYGKSAGTINTPAKIKKIEFIYPEHKKEYGIRVKKLSSREIKVSAKKLKRGEGLGEIIKVTYKNGRTQKFGISKHSEDFDVWRKKVIKELKALVADPDKGLKKALDEWNINDCEVVLVRATNSGTSIITIDEVMENYSSSEKRALILEAYCRARMTYSMAYGHSTNNKCVKAHTCKALYNGNFKGVCQDGAEKACEIAE